MTKHDSEDDTSREETANGNDSIIYPCHGNLKKGVEYYEKDLKIAKEVGDVPEKGGPMATSAMLIRAWATSKRP